MKLKPSVLVVCGLLLAGWYEPQVYSEDWTQFRGSDISGVSTKGNPPVSWSDDENIAWSAALPGRGLSSPIVVGDKVLVSACSGYRQDRLHVLCYSKSDGRLLWERQFWATGRTISHPKTCNAANTPCSDGQRVYVLFSSNDLVCLDLSGDLQWYRSLMGDFPNASNSLGMASSPIVVGGALVVPIENDSQSLATGLDLLTGEPLWKLDRPKRANWTSPVIFPGSSASADLAILQSSAGLAAVEPLTGKVVWAFDKGASTIPSSVVSGGIVYAPSGGITALDPRELTDHLGANSSPPSPKTVWKVDKLGPGTASPVVWNDRLYTINRAGVLLSASVQTGEIVWQLRLQGPFSGSPVVAANRLYACNENGQTTVVGLGDASGEVLAENKLTDTILCTPALSDNFIFVRSDQRLYCIGAN